VSGTALFHRRTLQRADARSETSRLLAVGWAATALPCADRPLWRWPRSGWRLRTAAVKGGR